MTFTEFQKDLVKEVEVILKDVICKTPDGGEVVGVKGYEQQLPVVTENDEDESKFFPYFIVRISDAVTQGDDEPWTVTADILFGCYEPDKLQTGHRHILVMIQRTADRFLAEPLLCKKYRAQPEMEVALQDEDTYPFFFGGARIKFSIPKMGRRLPAYENFI